MTVGGPSVDRRPGPSVPVRDRLPRGATTRFAPAPTGYLHLGHVVNAIYVWGIAMATDGRVVLRIEDHDRQRCRRAYEAALLDDLDWLGLALDLGTTAELRAGPSPFRQSDSGAAYVEALERLRAAGLVYSCDCTRGTFAAWAEANGSDWSGPGCPGDCRRRGVEPAAGTGVRVALGDGVERFDDLLLGPVADAPSRVGDLLARDRHGNWTYAFAVVVDDERHGVDLVVRGRDLVDATSRQIRLGRLLGRRMPPAFLHHPLIRKPGGAKLSKADGDTGVRDLRAAGWTSGRVLGEAAAAVRLLDRASPLRVDDLAELVVRGGARP